MAKIKLMVSFLLMFPAALIAQTDKSSVQSQDGYSNNIPESEKIWDVVDQMPTYPGGDEILFNYLKNTIKYPEDAKKKNISGKVFAEFVVTKDGKIKNTKILKGPDSELNKEVLRVINNMPDWIPGKQNGKNVNVNYVLPVNFNL